MGTYRLGEFIFQCPIIFPFHTVHGVLKAIILKWSAIPFSSGAHFVKTLQHDPSVLGGRTWHGLVSLSKDLHDQDNHDGVITHLEPDILKCEVKWALESITMNKASGGDGIPVELFQILKDDAVKVLLNMSANLEDSAVVTGLEKVSFHSNPKESQCQRMLKLPHNGTHFTR